MKYICKYTCKEYIYILILEHLNKFHKYSLYYDTKIIQIDLVVAEMYSFHFGDVIFEQRPKKEAGYQEVLTVHRGFILNIVQIESDLTSRT